MKKQEGDLIVPLYLQSQRVYLIDHLLILHRPSFISVFFIIPA